MRNFFKKILVFLIFPSLIYCVFIVLYIIRDPYFDIWKYENYSWKYYFQILGDLSTKKLLKSKTNYNSFIFGSSRATGLYARYLQSKIDNSIFFHYANWGENIGGIYGKMHLLDELGYKMNNVIIYLDTDHTFENDGKPKNDHYLITNKNKWSYCYAHFKNFIPPYINIERFNLLFFDRVNPETFRNWRSDSITNDPRLVTDSILKNYGSTVFDSKYLSKIDSLKRIGFLYERPISNQFKEKQISYDEYIALQNISKLLQKHNTKFYVVITPLYDQFKFDSSDMKKIRTVFGVNNVYDFSGINNITQNEYNYPDRKHFLPYISKLIADSILAVKSKNN